MRSVSVWSRAQSPQGAAAVAAALAGITDVASTKAAAYEGRPCLPGLGARPVGPLSLHLLRSAGHAGPRQASALGHDAMVLARRSTTSVAWLSLEASLAQLAEPALRKRMVAGSIPAGGFGPAGCPLAVQEMCFWLVNTERRRANVPANGLRARPRWPAQPQLLPLPLLPLPQLPLLPAQQ